jgi:hypothetical protein
MAENKWIIEDTPIQTSSQSESSFLGRTLGGGLFKGLQGLEGLASLLPNPQRAAYQASQDNPQSQLLKLLGGTGQQQVPSQVIQNQLGIEPEQLQPQGFIESGLQRFISQAPLAGALGGLSGLGTTAVGSAAATGAQALGAPESIQDITQLATELGTGAYKGKFPSIRSVQKAEDALTRAAVEPKTKVRAQTIKDAIAGVEKELGTEVSEKYSSKIKNALDTIKENIIRNKINPVNAVDLRKKLYKLGNELPGDIAATYIDPLTKSINKFFSIYGAENPEFYKHLTARDKLTELKNMKTVIADFLNLNSKYITELPVIGKIVPTILNGTINEVERFSRGILKNPQARKYYFNAVSAAAGNNPQLVVSNLNKVAQRIPELKEHHEDNKWIIE